MRRHAGLLALVLAVLTAVLIYGVDRAAEPVASSTPAGMVHDVDPTAGSWVCPVGDTRSGTGLTATIARPAVQGEVPGELALTVLEDGEQQRTVVPRLFPEAAVTQRPTTGGAVGVEWHEGPVVVHRQWRLDGEGESLPPGTIAGGCTHPYAQRWTIPGMATDGGAQARIRLANPFSTDATVAVRFVAPDGPERPLALRNLSVGSRDTLEIEVNDHLPERQDLTAIVEVASGRVAVEGYQLLHAAVGGIDGATLLSAADAAATTWTVPWIVDGEDLASWLWIHNPDDRPAEVELTYHTPDGGEVPEGLAEVMVDPGGLARVDLRGTLPEDHSVVAVTARSGGVPVVVSGATQLSSDQPERTAHAVQLGVSSPDRSWTVSGNASEGRTEQLHLVNPGGEEAAFSVSLFTGVTLQRPAELQELVLPPGARRTVDLSDHLGGTDEWTAFVDARSADVVVGRVGSSDEGQRHLVAGPGMPRASWQTQSAGLAAARSDGLVQRMATSQGIVDVEDPWRRPNDPAGNGEAGEAGGSPAPEGGSPDDGDDGSEVRTTPGEPSTGSDQPSSDGDGDAATPATSPTLDERLFGTPTTQPGDADGDTGTGDTGTGP